jgi:RNA polymerase sigma-70 factor (ECF subfamily)
MSSSFEQSEWWSDQFEQQRPRLRAVAYRMLGSTEEANDAVQEAWLRLNRSDAASIENLAGWLTTVVARICLNVLRTRRTRPEEPLDVRVPDPVVAGEASGDPEQQAVLADSVGLALLVVLEFLNPAERLAFVLHDMFAVPFDDIAVLLDRTPDSARQLASRARRRVQGAPIPDPDVNRQREVVNAFFAAARGGDFEALVALLDPDVVLRRDAGARGSMLVRGAADVAGQALLGANPAAILHPVTVNGGAGVVVTLRDRPVVIMAFTVVGGHVAEIDVISDQARLRGLDLAQLTGTSGAERPGGDRPG